MARQKKRGPHLVFVDGIWVTAEIAYLREMGERAYIEQTTPEARPVDPGVQLPLVDVPKDKKPTAKELYEQARRT